jgi:adenosylhomocysteinase
MKSDIKDPNLRKEGLRRIEWADNDMPVLRRIRERFAEEKPFSGLKMSACLHVTSETANLVRTLKAGGADIVLCASNPLSTQDDVAASLVHDHSIPVFAVKGEDRDTYYRHLKAALDHQPTITMDDGADLVTEILKGRKELHAKMIASMEETTTGVIRLKAMDREGALRFPVLAVNDAQCKHLFDNRYGTGQSTVDGFIRATNVLFAGKTVVVAGYGWCGRGFANRARGLGAIVVITEVDPVRALEAAMDGFQVMPMADAVKVGDLFCTLTGDIHVIRLEHFKAMKDGALVANSGHFNVELDLEALEKAAKKKVGIRQFVDQFTFPDGKRVFVLGEGRLINLVSAEGHPASVMDMSFAVQALGSEYMAKNRGKLAVKVHDVPSEIDEWVARLKLETMGLGIDRLTPEQETYLKSWQHGT